MDTITVGIADCRVSSNTDVRLVTHALGSCLAVVIHDPAAGVAGLLHLMLPDSSIDPAKGKDKPFMFADTGIPLLFRGAYALGADKRRLTVRLVGGAQILDSAGTFDIGKRNHLTARKILWAAGVMVHGEAVGGTVSRTVSVDVAEGRLIWHSAGGGPQELAVRKGAA
jgi:chemotaxis protein CheD